MGELVHPMTKLLVMFVGGMFIISSFAKALEIGVFESLSPFWEAIALMFADPFISFGILGVLYMFSLFVRPPGGGNEFKA